MNKPEQLRLAADIIEKNLPWERRTAGSEKWFNSGKSDPAILVTNGWEIRLAPPPPEPVPLTAEDVTPGSFLRSDKDHWFAVVYCKSTGVYIGSPVRSNIVAWAELKNHWQIKRPGSDTWEPCSKPA